MAGAPVKTGGNVFTRKLGPLPAWAWMAVVAALVLLVVVYEYKKGSSSTSSADEADTTPPTVFEFPADPDSASSGSTSGGTTTRTPPAKDAHPKAFHIGKGQSAPTTKHGNKTWVHGHYGPNGAYHAGHWSGAGKKGGG